MPHIITRFTKCMIRTFFCLKSGYRTKIIFLQLWLEAVENALQEIQLKEKETLVLLEKLKHRLERYHILEQELVEKNEKFGIYLEKIEAKNEKIERLENTVKDNKLKLVEQDNEFDMLRKKLRVLKDRDSKLTDLEVKFMELEKKFVNFSNSSENVDNKCSSCDFIAKNSQGLKVHIKAKHTAPLKFKRFVCDFSSATKSELTEHNDIYWNSHRMTFYPEKKKYYLEEMEQIKIDGFTVKENFYNQVMKSDG